MGTFLIRARLCGVIAYLYSMCEVCVILPYLLLLYIMCYLGLQNLGGALILTVMHFAFKSKFK